MAARNEATSSSEPSALSGTSGFAALRRGVESARHTGMACGVTVLIATLGAVVLLALDDYERVLGGQAMAGQTRRTRGA